jgi:glycosyltransferase involved in cell wall biosynthesis
LPHITFKSEIAGKAMAGVDGARLRRVWGNGAPDLPGVLLLARGGPQAIGGQQRHSLRLAQALAPHFRVELRHSPGPVWTSSFYLPAFVCKAAQSPAPVVHCDDGQTALIAPAIQRLARKKVLATVHGLDVMIPLPPYQAAIRPVLRRLEKVVCVSRATAQEVLKRGVDPDRVEVVPNAAEDPGPLALTKTQARERLKESHGLDLTGKRVLFSLGRPVRRKGFDRFARDVMPLLPPDFVYVVAGPDPGSPAWLSVCCDLPGGGPLRKLLSIQGWDTVHHQLRDLARDPRVFYLNNISEKMRHLLFLAADLFVMPNRRIAGDMEGFGIVALEAAVRGLPVAAVRIEGIKDAVIPHENGVGLPENDPQGVANEIRELLANPAGLELLGRRAAEFTKRRFSPPVIAGKYQAIFSELMEEEAGKG